MLSNKFIRLLKSMCGTANMVPRVAANNCDQALLANDGIANRYDPAWFCSRASRRAFFNVSEVSQIGGVFKSVEFMNKSWENYGTLIVRMISRRRV